MEDLSDAEFDHVRDFDMSDSESEAESIDHGTPSTTPPRTNTPHSTSTRVLSCPYNGCPKTFNRKSRLEEHLRSHTGERPFKCPHAFCAKDFLRDSHLKHHLTSAHSDVRKYECTWEGCGKSFATGTRLRRHVQSHEGKEKYRCRGYNGCNETFRKHETLRKHVLVVHEKQKPFACDHVNSRSGETCGKGFDTADRLKAHQRAIHDDTKFFCTICIAAHGSEDVLMNLEDDGLRAYQFGKYSDLQEHIAEAHPPTCHHCQATFITNKELTSHLEVRHGVVDPNKPSAKQFPCTYEDCPQVFTKKGNLSVHVKTVHERQKEFVCGETNTTVPPEVAPEVAHKPEVSTRGCGRSFTSKASLVEHVRTTHFGLLSKRAQREEKKRLKRAAEDDASVTSEPKRRMPRKDRGVKKSSTLSTLTGMDVAVESTADMTTCPFFSHKSPADDMVGNCFDNGDDDDDWNQLSGSMTLVGDQLYHNGQGYRLVSEDGSVEQTRFDDVLYMPCQPKTDDQDSEPFFPFDHETEHIHMPLDPILHNV